MFEGSGRLDPTTTFPALAEAIAGIVVRPERGAGVPVAEEARALLQLRRQLDARLLARIAAVDEQGLAAADGFGSTASWVRGMSNLDAAAATSLVAASRLADRLPALGEVLAAGKVGVEHLAAVAGGAPRVPHEVLAISDTTLATLAPHVRPSEMRRAASAIQARVDESSVKDDAAYLHDQRSVTLSKTFGDAFHLNGLLEPEAGAALSAALESLMAKRGVEDDRSVSQRRADALLELTGVALRSTELPDCGGDRPRVTFLVRTAATGDPFGLDRAGDPFGLADTVGAVTGDGPGSRFAGTHLEGQVGLSAHSGGPGSGLLIGSQAMFPWETIARLCCDADLNLAMVNDSGEILNYGRTRRYPSPAQRRALTLRDQGCVFPGCDRPPSQCQAHHLIFWSLSGPTDLDNLALICSFHHRLLHEGGWWLERVPPGQRSADNPYGAPGWVATAPDGRQLRHHRQPAA